MVYKTLLELFQIIPRFIQKDKTRIWYRKRFRAILSHIRVLSKRIKRGYGIENAFRAIPNHIRVLSKRIKCGYGI